MAASPMPRRSIDDEDESVRIAVRALGDMRSRALADQSASSSFGPTPALSIASTSTSPTLASPTLGPDDLALALDVDSPDFVSRVSHLPLVHSALRAYEHSKASSRVVKYGAEMMESSVKTISRPVIDRLPVNQLDEFARRQLDRFGYGSPPAPSRMPSYAPEAEDERGRALEQGWRSGLQIRDLSMARADESAVRDELPASNTDLAAASAGPSTPSQRGWRSGEDGEDGGRRLSEDGVRRSSEEERRVGDGSPMTEDPHERQQQQQQVVQRSRWQTIVSEASGISAALSEESMRRLQYCLQWLQYATNHVDGQILLLREFMEALQPPADSPYALNPNALIRPEQMQQLANVKRDVVDTVRQVVDVVSKYAGGALPEPARARVRGFILHLPQAWASAARRQQHHPADTAPPPSAGPAAAARGRGARRSARRTEPISRPASPSHTRSESGAAGGPTAGGARAAAQRILTLATESLDMMRGVTGVVKDSLVSADAWVERLRVVGLQRGAGATARIEDHHRPADGVVPRPFEIELDPLTLRIPPASASASTSVAASPVVSSAALSPLLRPSTAEGILGGSVSSLSLGGSGGSGARTPGALSHSASAVSLNGGGSVGKKAMFVEEGRARGRGSGSPGMDVDGEV